MASDNAHVLRKLADSLQGRNRPCSTGISFGRMAAIAPAAFVVRALEAEAQSRGIELVLEDRSGKAEAWADEELLRRVLLNLVGNALKHAGGGTVTVSAVRDPGDDATVALCVSDEGPGVAASEQERIFGRYYRLPGTQALRTEGLGLGLSIVRQIADGHGGFASVTNNAARGCTFRVDLPLFGSGGAALQQVRRALGPRGANAYAALAVEVEADEAAAVADRLVAALPAPTWNVLDLGHARLGVLRVGEDAAEGIERQVSHGLDAIVGAHAPCGWTAGVAGQRDAGEVIRGVMEALDHRGTAAAVR
jgi:hypothetical protein